jgi:hypothetical protein
MASVYWSRWCIILAYMYHGGAYMYHCGTFSSFITMGERVEEGASQPGGNGEMGRGNSPHFSHSAHTNPVPNFKFFI